MDYDAMMQELIQGNGVEAYMLLTPRDAEVTRYKIKNSKGEGVIARHSRLVTGFSKENEEVYMLKVHNNFLEVICVSFDDLASEYYCPFAIKFSYCNTK